MQLNRKIYGKPRTCVHFVGYEKTELAKWSTSEGISASQWPACTKIKSNFGKRRAFVPTWRERKRERDILESNKLIENQTIHFLFDYVCSI